MNWVKIAEQICVEQDKAGLQQFLDFGKLMKDMLASEEYARLTSAECFIMSEMAKKGHYFPQKYMQKAHSLYTRFTPVLHQRMMKLGMPVKVALVACYWADDVMAERLDIAQACGWQKIVEKYIMKQRSVNRRRTVDLAVEESLDLRKIRFSNGEWDHDAIQDILAHLMTVLGASFDEDLAVAYKRCGKKKEAAA